jgi:hypothetical protein
MAWFAGVQALSRATEQRSGPIHASQTVGMVSCWGGGPHTRCKAGGVGAVRSFRRLVAGDRRSRLELARCWQAGVRNQKRRRSGAWTETRPLRLQVCVGGSGPLARIAGRRVSAAEAGVCGDKIKKTC